MLNPFSLRNRFGSSSEVSQRSYSAMVYYCQLCGMNSGLSEHSINNRAISAYNPSATTLKPLICHACSVDLAPSPKLHMLPTIDAISLYSYQYPLDSYIAQYKNHAQLSILRLLHYLLAVGINPLWTGNADVDDNQHAAIVAWQQWHSQRKKPTSKHPMAPQWAIAALPSSHQRLRERGFSHTHLLCQQLAKHWQVPLYTGLVRSGHSAHQQSLSRNQRLRNVQGAFSLRQAPPPWVLLIDDVITTGSTLTAASASLQAQGTNVLGLALARAELVK